jgi:hypothetical protein
MKLNLEKMPRMDADTPWKNILELYFRDFMECCFSEISTKIDWSKNFESLDKELNAVSRGARQGRRLADKLMKVWLKGREGKWMLIHLEVQGQRDVDFSRRMFVYNYRLSDRHQVPIHSIAILTDGDSDWRPHDYRQVIFGCSIEINFLSIKILDFTMQRKNLEKSNNPFALVLLIQLIILETSKNLRARLLAKISLTRQLYHWKLQKDDIFQLHVFIDWLIVLPESLMLEYHQEVKRIEEEHEMARFITTAERVGLMKGRQEGMQQGMQRGQQGVAEVVVRALKRRFGAVDPMVISKIYQTDIDTLLNWEEKIATAKAVEDIIA